MAVKGQSLDMAKALKRAREGATLLSIADDFPVAFLRHHRALERMYFFTVEVDVFVWRNVDVQVYYGLTGTGKTRKAFADHPSIYPVMMTSNIIYWQDYLRQDAILLDDFYGQIKPSMMLRLLDGHKMMLPVKFGHSYAFWTKVVIIFNIHPDDWYTDIPEAVKQALKRRITHITHFGVFNE